MTRNLFRNKGSTTTRGSERSWNPKIGLNEVNNLNRHEDFVWSSRECEERGWMAVRRWRGGWSSPDYCDTSSVGQAIPGKASVNPVSIILSSLPPDSSSFDSRRRGQDKRESAAGGEWGQGFNPLRSVADQSRSRIRIVIREKIEGSAWIDISSANADAPSSPKLYI